MNLNVINELGRDNWKGLISYPVSSSRIIKTKIRLKLCDRSDVMNRSCEVILSRDCETMKKYVVQKIAQTK